MANDRDSSRAGRKRVTQRRISSLQRLIHIMTGAVGVLLIFFMVNFLNPTPTGTYSIGGSEEAHSHGHSHGHGMAPPGRAPVDQASLGGAAGGFRAQDGAPRRVAEQVATQPQERPQELPPRVVEPQAPAAPPVAPPPPPAAPVAPVAPPPPPAPVAPPPPPMGEGTYLKDPDYALNKAEVERAGGATQYDREWAKIRAKRRFAGIKRSSENPEPFMQTGMKDWTLFKTPENSWLVDASRLIDENKGLLSQPEDESLSSEVTIVTTLLDLKRATDAGGTFKRTMKEYYDRFNYILDRGFKMVIFMPDEFRQSLHIKDDRMTVVHMPSEDILNYFPYYQRVQEVRTSPLWTQQAEHIGWLKQSPQASLPGYDPLVMSKTFMLRDAAEMNPYNTKYFVFVDSGHMCAGAQDPNYMDVYTSHMDRGYLVTHWPYGTNSEVHGMCDKAMHIYTGAKDPLRIVRGGVFGARRTHIDIVTQIYDMALAESLSDGYMGTEENILAIIFARFPELFAGFDNNQFGIHGDNCALFTYQTRLKKEREKEALAAGLRGAK